MNRIRQPGLRNQEPPGPSPLPMVSVGLGCWHQGMHATFCFWAASLPQPDPAPCWGIPPAG